MEPSQLRPLQSAEIIDRSVVIWRKHLWTFFQLSFGLQLINYATTKLWLIPFNREMPGLRAATSVSPEAVLAFLPRLARPALLFLALVPFSAWLTWLARLAGTRFATAQALEQPITLGEAVRATLRQLGSATGSLVAGVLLTALLVLVCNVPALGMGGAALWALQGKHSLRALLLGLSALLFLLLGTTVGILWAVLRLALYLPVLSAENRSVLAALRRARDLMRGRIGPGLMGLVKVRTSVLLTALYLVVIVIGLVAGTPAAVIQVIYGGLFQKSGPTPEAVPQLFLIPAELLTVAVQAIFAPLLLLLPSVLYADMRARREGLDLEARLAQLDPPPRAAS